MKQNPLYLLVGIGLGILFILASFNESAVTGGAVVSPYDETEPKGTSRAYTLNRHALNFFNVEEVIFPQGVCIPSAHELYGNVAYSPVDVSAGYSSSGLERTSTLSFVVDRHERYGTIDFVKSPTFLKDRNSDSLISVSSEAIVRVPKASRTTYLVMDLYGVTRGPFLYITRGRFSTPTTDCIFLVEGGYAYCDCDVHTIQGIAVGGITNPPRVEDRYEQLVAEAQQKITDAGGPGEAVAAGDIMVSKVPPIPS